MLKEAEIAAPTHARSSLTKERENGRESDRDGLVRDWQIATSETTGWVQSCGTTKKKKLETLRSIHRKEDSQERKKCCGG
jgi:hypothetical protein